MTFLVFALCEVTHRVRLCGNSRQERETTNVNCVNYSYSLLHTVAGQSEVCYTKCSLYMQLKFAHCGKMYTVYIGLQLELENILTSCSRPFLEKLVVPRLKNCQQQIEPEVHWHLHQRLPVHIVSQINSASIQIFKMHSNIIHSVPRFSKWPLLSGFQPKCCMHFSSSQCIPHVQPILLFYKI